MKIEYDPEANALYITLREASITDTAEVTDNMTVDLDADGQPVGIEILDARQLLRPEGLSEVTLENLLSEDVRQGTLIYPKSFNKRYSHGVIRNSPKILKGVR